jgi:hypothetical protein
MTHAIIVPDAIRAACNQAAVQLGIDPEGTLTTLSVPLVPAGGPDDAEPTHWGACGMMPEQARAFLAANLSMFPGAMWWRWNPQGGNRLVAAHESDNIGQFWDWDNCLSRAGLKRHSLPMPLNPD